ncbi:MAG: choice-of-anchor J domain-containing protein [Ignavibacteriae bacterium]|nr:choice-of-anchor J domain-containing protein [Ignavibacteriota bacterium]
MKILITFLFILLVISINILNAQQIEEKFSQPYFEGFENTTFPPSGWQNINVSGNVTWMIGYFAHSGTQAAVCAWQTVGIGEDWLITPRWNILAGDSLVFWLRPFYVGHPPDSLAVRVSTTDSVMPSFTTRILLLAEGNGYPTSTIYQRYSVSLNQYANQGIFIAFKHMDQNGDGIFIDDV